MTYVFIANGPVIEGTRLDVPHFIIDQSEDHGAAYDVMANVQLTLPTHCIVGLCGRAIMGLDEDRMIVMDWCVGRAVKFK